MNLNDEIKKVAYELFVKSGCIAGRDMDNWLEAERIVMEKHNIQKAAGTASSDEMSELVESVPTEEIKAKKTRAKTTRKTATPKKATRRTSPKKAE